jgi:hypothetical protein
VARQRDYRKEYQQRQAKAQREGYRSYGAKRWTQIKQKLKQVVAPSAPSREELERQAVKRYVKHFGSLASPKRVGENMTALTDTALHRVTKASKRDLQRLARQQRPTAVTTAGKDVNPYWYH